MQYGIYKGQLISIYRRKSLQDSIRKILVFFLKLLFPLASYWLVYIDKPANRGHTSDDKNINGVLRVQSYMGNLPLNRVRSKCH